MITFAGNLKYMNEFKYSLNICKMAYLYVPPSCDWAHKLQWDGKKDILLFISSKGLFDWIILGRLTLVNVFFLEISFLIYSSVCFSSRTKSIFEV